MKIEILERISSVLELPVSYWFDETTSTGRPVSNENVSTATSDKISERGPFNVMHEKIDSLTKDLNEMLKEMASK